MKPAILCRIFALSLALSLAPFRVVQAEGPWNHVLTEQGVNVYVHRDNGKSKTGKFREGCGPVSCRPQVPRIQTRVDGNRLWRAIKPVDPL